MNTLSQHNQLTPRVKPRSLSLRSLSTVEASKGRLLFLRPLSPRFLSLSKESKGRHRLSFSRLALLLSLMLVNGLAMGQRNEDPGSGGASNQHVTIGGSVFGGGNKAAVAGNSAVTLNQRGAIIGTRNGGVLVDNTGDVYGGGALANVGTNSGNTTTLTILDGIIEGNVYGGGLGDSDDVCYGGAQNIAALVYGKVYVNIGRAPMGEETNPVGNATIKGSVFGCNNINGTPLDSVFVHVYRTGHTTVNHYPDSITDSSFDNMEKLRRAAIIANAEENYAIQNVYGGGNKASYKPELNDDDSYKCTTVHIHYCTENTIKTVYGGGNAADAGTAAKPANTHLIIDGGRIDRIFGGGNGYSQTGNHDDCTQDYYNPGANILGSATTDFNGGLCNQLFGGSNQYGDIAEANLNINDGGCAVQMILESFCGGNEANMTGADINATIANCDIRIGTLYGGSNKADILKDNVGNGGNVTLNVLGGNFDYVFGGSKGTPAPAPGATQEELDAASADIEGNVTLNLHGGKIIDAFGGSDVNGNILGNITVNVLDTIPEPCNLQVDTVYGAGRDAAYTPTDADAVSPLVKIQHATIGHGTGDEAVPGCVFGGGKGATATVTAHPYVIIGELNTINNPHDEPIDTRATVTGDVYGGGNAADVVGGTTVLVQKCNSSYAKYVYGGGNAAKVDSTKVYITGGTIDTLFGGGHGSITSNVSANVTYHDTISITGGTIGKAFSGSNLKGSIGGRMALNIDKSSATGACALKIGEVYGGSNRAVGKAGTITIGCTGTLTADHIAHPENIGTTLEGVGTVYGGANMADISNNIVLNINNGIINNVYGGNNTSGNITGTIQVNIDSIGGCPDHWYLGNVFGGGNQASYASTPDVNILHGTVTGSVYGGGNEAGVGGGDVTMSGGTVLTGLYGGCNTSGTVVGDITVSVTGGTIGASGDGNSANVHGGGYGPNTKTGANVEVTISQASGENPPAAPVIWGDVYGGSALGSVNSGDETPTVNTSCHTYVTLNKGTVHGDIYGGGLGNSTTEAKVWSPVQVTVNGGTVTGSIYGCNNAKGAPQSTVNVDVYGTDIPASGYAIGHVFGGGNAADYEGTPVVKVHNCSNKIEYVYGGGNAANVNGTNVTVYGGNSIAHVFGGCYGADVTADGTNVKIYGGTIDTIYGGNNESGEITGDISVTVNKQGDDDPNGSSTACDMHIKEVYGGGNKADSNAGQITINCTGTGATEGIEYVYGGANRANVTGPISLTIDEGCIGNVFGGNNHSGTITGGITVNIEKAASPCVWDVGNVFGGGNLAEYSGTPQVFIKNGTVANVYGGGNGDPNDDTQEPGQVAGTKVVIGDANESYCAIVTGNVYGGGNAAKVSGTSVVTYDDSHASSAVGQLFGGGNQAGVTGAATVTLTNGTVNTGVYGGCNSSGNVAGKITVNVNGGTIGSQSNLNNLITADVYGGGYGPSTSTSGNVEVNINNGIIYGDVYGGSALGNVNTENGSNTTVVNVMGGTLETQTTQHQTPNHQNYYIYHGGNVYGGGLGEPNVYDELGNLVTDNSAKGQVNGAVTVNIGTGTFEPGSDYTTTTSGEATIKGNVYGGNNTNGSPQENVTVNIYHTAHTTANEYGAVEIPGEDPTTYAIANVFGGGNEADFRVDGKTAQVNIYGCDNTIKRTFGGGNAAATNDVNTWIQGGRIYQVFGGGNGEVTAANINGTLNLNIHGGNIGQFYGASNQQGNITGGINVNVDNTSPCEDDLVIDEFFCGGNFAEIYSGIVTTIECSEGMEVHNIYGGCNQAKIWGDVVLNLRGGNYTNVYGGSKGVAGGISADINKYPASTDNPELAAWMTAHAGEFEVGDGGNVTLNLYGGTMVNVYGGSNINGNIEGKITVNVIDEEGTCPLHITNIYGGSNETDYVPNYTPIAPETERITPVVNVIHAKNGISGNVYGGSKGIVGAAVPTQVTANPLVNIGYDSSMSTYLPPTTTYNPASYSLKTTIQGSVFGGGDAAEVLGNTKVFLRNRAKVFGNVYGGGNMGEVKDNPDTVEVEGNTKVIVNGITPQP